jgi:signal transduction histidine kinase
MKNIFRFEKEIDNYTLYGVIFGFLFPIGATILECLHVYESLSLTNILRVQSETFLLWIIDSAPFWLGLFARFGGAKQDMVLEKSNQLQKKIHDLRVLSKSLEARVQLRTKEFLVAKEEAERSNRAKSEFLSRMSHELRTPLNAILGFGQLLQFDKENVLSFSQNDNVQEIIKAGNHLLQLINDILDLASIEAGKISTFPKNINLQTILEEAILLINPLARDKGILIDSQASSYPDLFIFADPIRLRQVLINLLSNAIKYNQEKGSVTLKLKIIEDEKVRITISDTGSGIDNNKLKFLFKPFYRLGADATEIEGTGIGLSITKQLVEMMQGSIFVESSPGEGSHFSIELPLGEKTNSPQDVPVAFNTDIDP